MRLVYLCGCVCDLCACVSVCMHDVSDVFDVFDLSDVYWAGCVSCVWWGFRGLDGCDVSNVAAQHRQHSLAHGIMYVTPQRGPSLPVPQAQLPPVPDTNPVRVGRSGNMPSIWYVGVGLEIISTMSGPSPCRAPRRRPLGV